MEALFTILWKSAAINLLFYAFYKMFLEKETYFKLIRVYFLFGIAASLLVPLIIIPVYQTVTPAETFQIYEVSNAGTASLAANTSFNWPGFLTYAYGLISTVFLLRFAFQIGAILNLIKKSKVSTGSSFYRVETSQETTPFSFFNFIVYNPELFKKAELEQIMAHEKVHASQNHSLDTLLANLFLAVQWFNPFAWFFKKELEQNLEFIADENAIKKSKNKQSYQELLLKTTVPNYQMALANNFYNSLLKKRIIMIHKQRSNRNSQWKIALMAPLLLAFIFTFNTKVIAQDKKVEKKVVKKEMKVEVFAMGFSKGTSKEKLDKLVADFAEKGLDVKFSGIKRNKDKEITAIKVDAKAKSGKASAAYAADNDEGISQITISYDNENNNLSIGSGKGHGMHRYSMGGKGKHKMRVHKGKGKGSHFVFSTDDMDDEDMNIFISKDGDTTKVMSKTMVIDIDEDGKHKGKNVWVSKKDGKKTIIKIDGDSKNEIHEIIIDEDGDGKKVKKEIIKIKGGKGKGKGDMIFISEDDDDENTVTSYIVNGKKMTKEELKKMDPDKIETIEIKKEVKKKK